MAIRWDWLPIHLPLVPALRSRQLLLVRHVRTTSKRPNNIAIRDGSAIKFATGDLGITNNKGVSMKTSVISTMGRPVALSASPLGFSVGLRAVRRKEQELAIQTGDAGMGGRLTEMTQSTKPISRTAFNTTNASATNERHKNTLA